MAQVGQDPVAVAKQAAASAEVKAEDAASSAEQVVKLNQFVAIFNVMAVEEVVRLTSDLAFLTEIKMKEDPSAQVLEFASAVAESSITDYVGFLTRKKRKKEGE